MTTEKPREYCGLCGITGGDSVLEQVHLGIHSLQHRGQEAAGVMAVVGGVPCLHKAAGLVEHVQRRESGGDVRQGILTRADRNGHIGHGGPGVTSRVTVRIIRIPHDSAGATTHFRRSPGPLELIGC